MKSLRLSHLSSQVTFLAFILLITGSVRPTTIQTEDDIHISNLHHIVDDLYAFGENVTVDGLIEGDLVAGAYEVYTNGEVTESQNVFAYKLHHTGTVGNSLRAFVNTAVIDGQVGRSLMLFGYDSHIGKGAVIKRDVNIYGYTTRVEGRVGGDVKIRGDRIFISGEIDGDVDLEGEQITISPPAVIKGNLTYCCAKKVEIDTAAGVRILGETRSVQPVCETEEEDEEKSGAFKTTVLQISKLLAAFLFGIIVIYLFRKYAQESFKQLRTRFGVAAATGFLSLIILIVAVLILVVSAVFLIVGLVLISGNLAPVGALVLALSILMVPITSFATVSGGIIFYSGKILFALLVGFLLLRVFKPDPAMLSKTQLLLGLIVLTLLFLIPYLGFLVYILVTIIGAGGIVLGIKNCRPGVNQANSSSAATVRSEQ